MAESEACLENAASVVNDKSSAGSASAEKNASRLAPMPSKLDPVSKAEIIVKNLASPKQISDQQEIAGE